MAASNLLTLIDDIAALLDDIALMTKVAAHKTVSVVGDDLALNAQQVSGVSAEREIPVVLAVAKGSFINKAILVPLAILISIFAHNLIMPLLLTGGLYLCYEGVEKIFSTFIKGNTSCSKKVINENVKDYEAKKIKGAIRTDFVLSTEIIVIALGTVASSTIMTQILVLSIIAVTMTIGVYGIVAAIVKMDDLGLYLSKKSSLILNKIGRSILLIAPKLMKFISIIGTLAMFLVGGSIILHTLPLHSIIHIESLTAMPLINKLLSYCLEIVIGIVSGIIVLPIGLFFQKKFSARKN